MTKPDNLCRNSHKSLKVRLVLFVYEHTALEKLTGLQQVAVQRSVLFLLYTAFLQSTQIEDQRTTTITMRKKLYWDNTNTRLLRQVVVNEKILTIMTQSYIYFGK